MLRQRVKYVCIAFLLSVFLSGTANAKEYAFFAKTHNFYDTEPVYFLSALDGSFDSPFFGGKSAVSLDEQEIGFRFRRLSLTWVRKSHTWITFESQTAELLHTVANHLPLLVGNQYPIELKAKQYTFQGVRTDYQLFSSPAFQLRLGGTYIVGEDLLDGSTQGTVTATAANEYEFTNVLLDYRYRKDDLFYNETPPPEGRGYAFDFDLTWKPDARLELQMHASDLLGRIYWHNAPYTVAHIDSDTKTYDADGYVRFNPTLSGNQGGRDFTQTLNSQVMSQITFKLQSKAALLADLLVTPIKSYPRFGYRRMLGDRNIFDALVNPQDSTLHVRWSYRWLSIAISSDNLNLSKARAFALTTSIVTAPMD